MPTTQALTRFTLMAYQIERGDTLEDGSKVYDISPSVTEPGKIVIASALDDVCSAGIYAGDTTVAILTDGVI